MTLKRLFPLFVIILIASILVSSCKKDDEEDPKNNPPSAPTVSDPLHMYGNYFYVNWIGVVGAEGYVVDVATDQDFTNILPDYNNKEITIDGMFVVEGLNISTSYYVRMRAYNNNGTSSNSVFKKFTTRAADVLPNMSFEDWLVYPNYESPSPEGVWTSANKVADLDPNLYHAVLFKTDDAVSGNFAAKMVSADQGGLNLVTGSLYTGVFSVNLNNPLESMISGVPYKSKPNRFQGWYKYSPIDGDSCEIRTTLSRWNPVTKKKDIIAQAIMRDTNIVAEYTFFDLPIIYYITDQDPDTIDVVFAASAGGEYFIGGDGSTLFIDDFTLIFE